MTPSTAPNRDRVRRLFALTPALLLASTFALVLPACAAADRPAQGKTPMITADLWTVLDRLPSLLPFAPEKVSGALGVTLTKASENEYFAFYKGGGVALADGVFIENIDLRIRKEQPHPGFLVVTLSGTCVQTASVFGRYERLAMTEHPRGRSLDEEASYSRQEPWGKLSFGFSERARDCLRTVVFDPK